LAGAIKGREPPVPSPTVTPTVTTTVTVPPAVTPAREEPRVEAKGGSLAEAAARAAAEKGQKAVYADMGSTDVETSRARAVAAGKDPSRVAGGQGRNVAADGTPYWGPVDNESAREKASGKVITVNQEECISCGTCVEQTDKVFFLGSEESAKATPIAQDGPMELIQDAIEQCPVTCIHWVPPEEAEARGLATGRG
jgi:ferredoxin